MGKRVLLVGATGLVGQGVLEVFLQASDITGISVLVRRPFDAPHPKVRVLQAPAFTADALATLDLQGHDACLYCAGPLPVGMTEAAYREATVATLARVVEAYGAANPAGFVAYVSGAGADASSRLMHCASKARRKACSPARGWRIPACGRAWCARCWARPRRIGCGAPCTRWATPRWPSPHACCRAC